MAARQPLPITEELMVELEMRLAWASTARPHPHLTPLQQPEYDELDDGSFVREWQQAVLLVDARKCFFLMTSPDFGAQEPTTTPCFEYIAAALAILCGYFLKKNGSPNYTAAAAGLGHRTTKPELVREWASKLLALENDLAAVSTEQFAIWCVYAEERRRVWEEPFVCRFDWNAVTAKQDAIHGIEPSLDPRRGGRPIDPCSARQQKLRERDIPLPKPKRGRPVDPTSARQQKMREREERRRLQAQEPREPRRPLKILKVRQAWRVRLHDTSSLLQPIHLCSQLCTHIPL